MDRKPAGAGPKNRGWSDHAQSVAFFGAHAPRDGGGRGEAAEDRQSLWRIVRTCASAYRLAGISFPCLKVDLPGGAAERGYAVLRPLKSDDLILSPTRQTVGVEDPFLQSADAPNYFAAAWHARSFLKGLDGNSASARPGCADRQFPGLALAGPAPHTHRVSASGRAALPCCGRAEAAAQRMDPCGPDRSRPSLLWRARQGNGLRAAQPLSHRGARVRGRGGEHTAG